MDLVKAIIFFTIIALDVLIPAHTITRTSYDYASKAQVLGENTIATRSSEIANIYRNLEMNIRAIQNSSDSAKEEKIKKIKAEYLKLINGKQGQIPTATSEAKSHLQNREAEKEKIKKEKEHYKAQLEHIKDVKKRQAILTINTKIASINKNSTDKFNTALNKLGTILTSLSNKVTTLTSTHDTTSLEADILKVRVVLTDAQAEVLAQSSKEYILDLASDEAKLKGSVAPIINTFHKDMYHTHQVVMNAKDEVIKIYKAFHELTLPTPTP